MLSIAGLLSIASTLPATAAHATSADQLVGLFIQGCMPFVGDPAALRAWAQQTGLPPVPDPARAAFLHDAPGRVFDGSAPDTKLVLVSSDDGLCSVVTNQATRQQVNDALEAGLRKAGLDFRMVIERDDTHMREIHDQEYLAVRNKLGWRILAATVKGTTGGEAMLTAAPE